VTRLRKLMLEELERRNYSPSTVRAYLCAVEGFARYFNCPPDQLGLDQIRQYQAYLFRERKLEPNTVIQHLGGIRFLYIRALPLSWSAELTPYPKKALHLPSILSQEEVNTLIEAAPTPFQRTLLMAFYATGVRRVELARCLAVSPQPLAHSRPSDLPQGHLDSLQRSRPARRYP
jgi:integrase/recombinase XerD